MECHHATAPSKLRGPESCSETLNKKYFAVLQPAEGTSRQRPLPNPALVGMKACIEDIGRVESSKAYPKLHLDLWLISSGHRAGVRPASGKGVVAGGCFQAALGRSCCGRFPPVAPHTESLSMAHLSWD